MAETSAAEMHDYLAYWACSAGSGRLRVRGPDADTVRADIEANASRYGLRENVTVLRILRCVVIEPADDRVPD